MRTWRIKGLLVLGAVGLAVAIASATMPRATKPRPPVATPIPMATAIAAPTRSATWPPGPIVVSTNDVTIDGVTITTTSHRGIAIKAWGTADSPIRNLTIRNCRISGFGTAIDARHVENLIVENCTIEDAAYAGVLVYSGIGGRIAGNTIQRIGVGVDTNGPDENNAYGIALSRIATSDFVADPRSSDFTVDHNIVEDVPLWHGIDTHAGRRITISNNVIRRSPRPIFITVDGIGTHPEDITVIGNRIEDAVEVPGGTNLRAITLVNLQRGAIMDNLVSTAYPTPWVYDYVGLDPAGSVDVTISGQQGIP